MRAGVLFALLLIWPLGRFAGAIRTLGRTPMVVQATTAGKPDPLPNVWLVETTADQEIYSNGLRIETRFTVENTQRKYRAFPVGAEQPESGEERNWPAGIVFHTTESHLVRFEQDKSAELKRFGESLLRFVQNEKAYHYVIDRFGRVWRIVREGDTAFHAGHSVWADARNTYVGLNQSFLGVSVEAQTRGDNGRPSANTAQVHALRVLTEMLRGKYRLASANCVTHAQVSVNPANRQLSYHTDWALGFPYADVGLPDNYALPSAAIWVFGFTYDPSLVNLSGTPFWRGLLMGEEQLRQGATAHGAPLASYRSALFDRYQRVLASVRQKNGKTGTEEIREKKG